MAKPNGTNHEQQSSQRVLQVRQSAVEIESTRERKKITPPTREVEFAVLRDGRMVDLVRSIRQPSNLQFSDFLAVWPPDITSVTRHSSTSLTTI